ncbi:MAG: hypothetical protein PVH00_04130 [Gemmatimonadota bacterium]|jgi:hypothetical protein
MRLVYWYTPFVDLVAEVGNFVTAGNAFHRATKKKTYIDCATRQPPLGGLVQGDRLYVVGHGDTAQGLLVSDLPATAPPGFSDHFGKPALTADQLVAKMEQDGCDWKITDIRIYACKAAAGKKSFVSQFTRNVRQKNRDIVVFGYTALLDRSTMPGGKQGTAVAGARQAPASTFRKRLGLPDPNAQPAGGSGMVWQTPGGIGSGTAPGAVVWTTSRLVP